MTKKKNKKIYFGIDTQNAIIEYNNTDNKRYKNKLWEEHIDYAFNKLVENIINRYKFYNTELTYYDLKNDTISFLISKIHKYNPNTGAKAYSYFGTIAKNYLIQKVNKNIKHMKIHDDVEELYEYTCKTKEENNINLHEVDDHSELFNLIIDETKKEIRSNINNKESKKYLKLLQSLLLIFQSRNELMTLNKKYLYNYIKEISELSSSEITKYLKEAKYNYLDKLYRDYFNEQI